MTRPTPARYSGTPLASKLGYKASTRAVTVDAPENYLQLLAPLPGDVRFDRLPTTETELVHVFVTELRDR